MLKLQFQNIITRGIILILAVQILNLSINSIDFKPVESVNIAEFNDMNTIVEFVSEIVLGKINAFPEFSTPTQKQSQLQKHISFKIINNPEFFETNWVEQELPVFCSKLKESYIYCFINEINPPPPKA